MNTTSSGTAPKHGLLPCIGPEHHLPPPNRHGITAIHSSGRWTHRDFKGVLRVMDAMKPKLDAAFAKPVILNAEESAELSAMLARKQQQ